MIVIHFVGGCKAHNLGSQLPCRDAGEGTQSGGRESTLLLNIHLSSRMSVLHLLLLAQFVNSYYRAAWNATRS